MDKDEIRREMRTRRRELTPAERDEASAVVCAKLGRCTGLGEANGPFKAGSLIAVYLASPDEIDLHAYIERLLWFGCKVVAPRWNGETYELAILKGFDARHLRRGPMGIMEPVDAEIVPAQDVHGWIVPGLAFTRDGRRLGYGGGWYDRLLADAPKDAVKLGVAHSFQVVEDLPAEPHDIQLTAVVDDSLGDNGKTRDTHGEYSWAVRTYECGPDGVATMASVCNWLQEAASLNAEALAFSKSNFEAAGENISWVLTHLKVRMSRFPKWGEKVSILTFPRGGRRIVAWRDFVLTGEGGAELGRATSEWMLIDLASRKIVAIPEAVFAAANTVREPVFGDEPFAKLRWDCRETTADALVFRARRGDIDLNGHVNNVHYVEWLMEGRSDAAGPCRELDIVFKSETLAGEEVRVESVETEPGVFLHRVFAPDGHDHVIGRTAF